MKAALVLVLALGALVSFSSAMSMAGMALPNSDMQQPSRMARHPVCASDGSNTWIFSSRHHYQRAAQQSSRHLYQIPLFTCEPTDPNVNMMDEEQMQQAGEVQARIHTWPRAYKPWRH